MGYYKDQAIQKMIDPAKSRKGKNSRARGNAFEREVAKRLLGQRVGQFGGKQDVANDWLAVQCKVGGSFSERHTTTPSTAATRYSRTSSRVDAKAGVRFGEGFGGGPGRTRGGA